MEALLSAVQKSVLGAATKGQQLKSILIYNNDTTNKIWVENGEAATVANWFPILPGKSLTVRLDNLTTLNLIAETANIDARIILWL